MTGPSPTPTPALSLHLPTFRDEPGSWRSMMDRALAADDAGIDRVTVSDHVVMGENLDQYGRPEVGGITGGVQPTGPEGQWLEPLTTLSVIAGATSRVRLGTNVLLAALRRPIVLAKATATLDVLSGGRLDLGVGVGWQREEYEASGLSFTERGRLLDHTLEVLRGAWQDSPTSHDSERLTFDRVYVQPQPLQPGGVPVWVSGTINPRTLRRIARFGSAWIPWGDDIKHPAAGLARIHEALAEAGRSAEGFRVQGRLAVGVDERGRPDLADALKGVGEAVQAGITDFALWMELPDGRAEATDRLREVVTAFRAETG